MSTTETEVPDVAGVEYRSIGLSSLETRLAPDEEGTFSGYANMHEITDSFGTRFAQGSWTAGGLDANTYALLDMHDETKRLGTFTATEDDQGLRIDGRYDDTQAGRDARAQARSGSAPELSVGFVRTGVDPEDPDHITSARLVEVSQITARMASQVGARLLSVRAREAHVEDRAKTRCVTCKRFVNKPLCKRCMTKEGRSDDEREVGGNIDPPDGSYEAIIETVEDALEAWATSRYSPTPVDVEVVATWPDRVVVTVYGASSNDDGDTWSLPYVIGANEAVTLGDPTPVEVVATIQPADADDTNYGQMSAETPMELRLRRAAALRLAAV